MSFLFMLIDLDDCKLFNGFVFDNNSLIACDSDQHAPSLPIG